MKLQKFKKTFNNLHSDNFYLKVIVMVLAISVISLVWKANSKDTVITIIPPTMAEQGWLDRQKASESYTSAWALYIAYMLGNANPKNGTLIKTAITPLLDTSIQADILAAIDDQIGQIRRDSVSITFEAKQILQDKRTPNKYYVYGDSSVSGSVGNKVDARRTYEMDIEIRNYKPVITLVKTYSGQPKTPETLEREKRMTDRKQEMRKKQGL
ncbi:MULTISPECIES: TraE/TraK family type IV conjugative transfer system protein [Pseudomonas]|uniref:TraE/TraK family type IV conjugative transfer system protein n=1 Tax=Pseudomonas TaxID=286 RepID=UPI0018678EA8|nr:TraE/TraK family type IV conjugative transfer system protein [Pseudomonas lundensis]